MRRSKRIKFEAPMLVTSLDPKFVFSERCESMIVNAQGCAFRSPRPIEYGTPIEVRLLESGAIAKARSLECHPFGRYWAIGMELEKPGNFWQVKDPPADWLPERAVTAPAARESVREPAFGQISESHVATESPATASRIDLRHLESEVRARARTIAIDFEKEYRHTLGSLVLRLRADLEARASEDLERLERQSRTTLEQAAAQLQEQVDKRLREWQQQAQAAEEKLGSLKRLRSELEGDIHRLEGLARARAMEAREDAGAEAGRNVGELARSLEEKLRQAELLREQLEQDSAQQLQELRQARAYIESLVRVVPETINKKLQEGAVAALQALRERSGREVSSRVASEMADFEERVHVAGEQVCSELRQKLFEDFDRREREFLDLISVRLEEARAAQAHVRETARQATADLSVQTEVSMAELRSNLEQMLHNRQPQLAEAVINSGLPAQQAEVDRLRREVRDARQNFEEETARLQEQREQLAQELEQARQAREYLESLVRSLPESVDRQVQERANSILQTVRAHWDNELATRFEAQTSELWRRVEVAQADFEQRLDKRVNECIQQRAGQLAAALDDRAQEVSRIQEQVQQRLTEFSQQMAQQAETAAAALQSRLQESLSARQQELQAEMARLGGELRGKAEAAWAQLGERLGGAVQEKVGSEMQREREQLLGLQQSVRNQLNHLAAEGEAMSSRVDKVVAEGVARAVEEAGARFREQMARITEVSRTEVLEKARAQFQQELQHTVSRSENVARDLHHLLDALQAENTRGEQQAGALREHLLQLQNWVAQETHRFQQVVHDSLLQASGEVRGRIRLAIEMAEEPIRRRAEELVAQLDQVAAQNSQVVGQQLQEAQQHLQAFRDATEASVGQFLQARLVEALEIFRQDAEKLAQGSIARWQQALSASLSSLPSVLKQKLAESGG